jgi:dipeptidyl aminopeptidase/acylaminoacyl peptidase
VRDSYDFTNTKFVQKQIGTNRSDLKARSPYYHADKVKIPMLFIHGEEDLVVDVEQSRIMVEELEDYDKSVEYIELENGDHHLSLQRNRHIAFNAMDTFLKKHLDKD